VAPAAPVHLQGFLPASHLLAGVQIGAIGENIGLKLLQRHGLKPEFYHGICHDLTEFMDWFKGNLPGKPWNPPLIILI